MSGTDTVDIVVAEDEFFTRKGICGLLAEEPRFRVVGDTEDGEQAVALVLEKDPRVLLLDLRMPPGIGGIEVIERLRALNHPVRIIALSHDKRLIRAVERAGGNGYVPKDKVPMFIPTVQCVAATGHNVFINPETSAAYQDLVARLERAELSEQEMAVWKLIAYKNEEIARRRFKAVGRIRNIVTELYFKLDIPRNDRLSQRMQAVQMARLLGILEEPDDLA